MSIPANRREKLAAALKRNVARRKEASAESPKAPPSSGAQSDVQPQDQAKGASHVAR